MKNKFWLYFFSAVVGYGWGFSSDVHFFSAKESGESALASSLQWQTLEKYEKLPCPTEGQFLELAKYVKLEVPEGDSLDVNCSTKNYRAVLGKSLLLMSSLKFDFPEDWPQELKANLGNPLKFLADRSSKLTLDLMQKDSLAYNKVQSKEIFLGGRFFTIDPLAGVAILIHEARHSEPQASGHVHCEAGDVPRSVGACDEVFSLEDNVAGAYGYGTLFNFSLALHARDIAPSDRESAMAEAMIELGARFNILPEVLAKKNDLLVVLGEDGVISWVHPTTQALTPLELKFLDGERPVRLEFNSKHNGLAIYTSKNTIWEWHPVSGLSQFYPDLIRSADQIVDIARTRVPFGDITLYALRDVNNNLFYLEYSPTLNKRLKSPYPRTITRPESEAPSSPFHRMFLALFDESVFLTEAGKIYFAQHYGNDPVFMDKTNLQSPQGYIAGTGGVLYDSLYLIDTRGDLNQVSLELIPGDEMIDDKAFDLKESSLRVPKPLRKFAQGLGLSMGLDRDGQLHVWGLGQVESHPVKLPGAVKDFVLIQMMDVKPRVSKIPKEFQDLWKLPADSGKAYQP